MCITCEILSLNKESVDSPNVSSVMTKFSSLDYSKSYKKPCRASIREAERAVSWGKFPTDKKKLCLLSSAGCFQMQRYQQIFEIDNEIDFEFKGSPIVEFRHINIYNSIATQKSSKWRRSER